MESCIFCKIIKGEIPCNKIYEDDKVLAFLDIRPINEGHTLVVPKHHCKDIFEASPGELKDMISVAKDLSEKIMDAVDADGINIGINNKPAAGQVVMHTHLHIIPRFSNDGHRHWPGKEVSKEELDKTAEKILK